MVRLRGGDLRVARSADLRAYPLAGIPKRVSGEIDRLGVKLRVPAITAGAAAPDCRQQERGRSESGRRHEAILAEVAPKRKDPPAPCGTDGPCFRLTRKGQKVSRADRPMVRPFRYSTIR